jgi:hypothetical protein
MVLLSDQLLMNIKTIQDIGKTIENDAKALESSLQGQWQNQTETSANWTRFDTLYNGKDGGKGSLGKNLPACLQKDFENYENKQKSELNDILQKRQQIGHQLYEASSLMDFQDKLTQKQFADINIYSANNYYNSGSETVLSHLQVPQGFETHSDSK